MAVVGGCSVMWHSKVWHRSLLERGTKAPLGKRAFCRVWTDGTDTTLTFLQGLWPLDRPISGEIHEQLPSEEAAVY